jgi:hypothetical protein
VARAAAGVGGACGADGAGGAGDSGVKHGVEGVISAKQIACFY